MIDNLNDFLKALYNVDQKQIDKWFKVIEQQEECND